MLEDRYNAWVENSQGIMQIEMLLVGNAQGLGLLDIELLKDFPELKIESQLDEDRLKKLRHITLSELWVMGAYELIRLVDEMMSRPNNTFSEEAKKEVKKTLKIFTEVRIPVVKFQDWGKSELWSGVPQPSFDLIKGTGWKVHFVRNNKIETKFFYRKDLADSLLELLKKLKENIHKKL